jgi:hypothetical protein
MTTRTRKLLATLCLIVFVAGCGRAVENAGVGAGRAQREVPHRPPEIPPKGPIPKAEPAPANHAVNARKARILGTIRNVSAEDRAAVIRGACTLYTVYRLSQIEDKEELVREALIEVGGDYTIALRAVEFLAELRSSSVQDAVGSMAVTSVCGP